jgi:hypothetical protein
LHVPCIVSHLPGAQQSESDVHNEPMLAQQAASPASSTKHCCPTSQHEPGPEPPSVGHGSPVVNMQPLEQRCEIALHIRFAGHMHMPPQPSLPHRKPAHNGWHSLVASMGGLMHAPTIWYVVPSLAHS